MTARQKGLMVLYPYPGHCPSNVNKDAKYSVVHGAGGMEIRLIYRVSRREKYLLTTKHDELADMVNAVKAEINDGTLGGAFYINEYKDVLVPHPEYGSVYAGTYERHLKFEYEGRELGPVPPLSLRPGDRWLGPRPGICYVLAAGGRDIRYAKREGNRLTEHHLSDYVGADQAAKIARRLATIKGTDGGRVYINEAGYFFTPMPNGGEGNVDIYLGALDEDRWFPVPDVPARP